MVACSHDVGKGKGGQLEDAPVDTGDCESYMSDRRDGGLLCPHRDIVAHKMLEVSCWRTVVTLLLKKSNLQDTCPVSVLCLDHKILSRALVNRLKEAMEQVLPGFRATGRLAGPWWTMST